MSLPPHPYPHGRVSLLTRHEKERAISPLFRARLDMSVDVVGDFDTDMLGTFTREVPRQGTQREAARQKAQIAIERSGNRFGLGSEGSFGPGPWGFGVWNLELLVFLDAERDLEVVGSALEPGLHLHDRVRTRAELEAFAQRAGFPGHGLVVRAEDENHPVLFKGLCDWEALYGAFTKAQEASPLGQVFVENDLRAHQHPSRMANIARAAEDLLERLLERCPSCQMPGFGRCEKIPGLPCADCGTPTRLPLQEEWACVKCPERQRKALAGAKVASPAQCEVCNP